MKPHVHVTSNLACFHPLICAGKHDEISWWHQEIMSEGPFYRKIAQKRVRRHIDFFVFFGASMAKHYLSRISEFSYRNENRPYPVNIP